MLTQKARDLWFHFGSGKNLCFEISSYIIMFTRIFHHHCFRDGIKNLHFELLTDLVNLLPVIICNLWLNFYPMGSHFPFFILWILRSYWCVLKANLLRKIIPWNSLLWEKEFFSKHINKLMICKVPRIKKK